ncbi:MAG: hypothetical protein ACF8XB_20450 [Planctomycetota bacterium JB042]
MRAGVIVKSSALALISVSLSACGPIGDGAFLGRTLADVEASRELTWVAERQYVDYVGTTPSVAIERFTHGPDGAFRVDLLELNGKAPVDMSASEFEAFETLQELLQGGRGRHVARMRDFEVRDTELFAANYSWTVFDTPASVAGRAALVAEAKPHRMDRPWYRVWVDQLNLVTLKYEEFLPSGTLASEMEVLSIEFAPDLSEVEFQASLRSAPQEIAPEQIGAFVAFEALVPSYLPEGFVLTSCRLSGLAGSPALVLSYEDGLQELLLVQYQELEPSEPLEGVPVTVKVAAYGPTVDADLRLIGTQLHVTAKVTEGEIMAVIEGLEIASP